MTDSPLQPADIFRLKCRQVPVFLFLGLSALFSAISGALLTYHAFYTSPIWFLVTYLSLLSITTLITVGIPLKEAGISSISEMRELISSLSLKYKIMVSTYLWISFGFLAIYPFIHSSMPILPSTTLGFGVGVYCFLLSIQLGVANYVFHGHVQYDEEYIKQLTENLPDDFPSPDDNINLNEDK